MTPQPLDPDRDLAAVREATAALLDAVGELDTAALAEPSQLMGWSRGHVLAHLSRSADSMLNLLSWARTGEETPQYASAETREKAIELGADRPLDEQLVDLRESAERFWEAARSLNEQAPHAWAAQVRLRSGKVIAAAELPWRRLVELHLHHVDLDIGYTPGELPAEFTARELEFVVEDLHAHEGVAAVRLTDSDTGQQWDIGAAEEPECQVTGPMYALMAWLTGRSSGAGLVIEPEAPLPKLPPLG